MEELKRFRQFLAEGQINENIEQIFKDTYEGYAEGFQGDPDEVDEFTWEAEEMTNPENYEDDRIAQFKAMQDYLKKNKQYADTIYGAKVTFTLEPNGEDIKMISDPTGGKQMNESELPKDSPAMEKNGIQDFLSRLIPEEWPGSWQGDINTGTFTAPYEHTMLVAEPDEVEDYLHGYGGEETIDQLPTEWVKVEEYTTGKHSGTDYQVMIFAKHVPGKGIYMAATTDAISDVSEVNKQVERSLKERSTPIVSRGKAFIKYNDLGPRTTAADIKKWVDDNFEKYAIKGDDKSEVLKTLTAYNDELMS